MVWLPYLGTPVRLFSCPWYVRFFPSVRVRVRYSCAALPSAVDWVSMGAVTDPKDEGKCGSCRTGPSLSSLSLSLSLSLFLSLSLSLSLSPSLSLSLSLSITFHHCA